MSDVKLKPCPFCGKYTRSLQALANKRDFYVFCRHCVTSGPIKRGAEAALEAWNTRVPCTGEEED